MNDNPLDLMLSTLSGNLTIQDKEKLKEKLQVYINHLLVNDFHKLISILYRVDVSEKKLKQLLFEHPQTDAALLITQLLIERQEEKIRSKQASKKDDNIPEDEKW
jgi:hypothetical protein